MSSPGRSFPAGARPERIASAAAPPLKTDISNYCRLFPNLSTLVSRNRNLLTRISRVTNGLSASLDLLVSRHSWRRIGSRSFARRALGRATRSEGSAGQQERPAERPCEPQFCGGREARECLAPGVETAVKFNRVSQRSMEVAEETRLLPTTTGFAARRAI